MLRHATFRQLEIFEAIARLGSFTRASEALHLTQPTVSMQVKKLSDAVGLPLYEQIGKQIHLTDAGRELAQTAREIIRSMEHHDMWVAQQKGLAQGKLRLAVVTTAKYFAPRLLGEFARRHPGIAVALKVTNRQRVLERVADNLDDLYILSGPLDDQPLEASAFMLNPLVVMAPPGHPLAACRQIPLARLAEETILMREPGSGTRASVEELFTAHGLKIREGLELGSNEAIKQAILGGLGISILSRHVLAGRIGPDEPVELDVEGFPVLRHWHVAYPSGKQLSVVASAFLDFLWEAVAAERGTAPAAVGGDAAPAPKPVAAPRTGRSRGR